MNQSDKTFYHTLADVEATVVLIPFGLYMNKGVGTLARGDVVAFVGENKVRKKIRHKRKISIDSSEFSIWFDLIYGDKMTRGMVEREWEHQSIIMGYGKNGFSRKECWLLILDEDESEIRKQENPVRRYLI